MVNGWTRDDLPAVMDLVKASVDAMAIDPSGGAYAALDAVVEHLNAHHPKPEPDRFERQAATISELQGSFLRVERERDEWKQEHDLLVVHGSVRGDTYAAMVRDRDDWRDKAYSASEGMRKAVARAEATERSRDAWKARADAAKARAEAAEARTAVTREDVEKAVRSGMSGFAAALGEQCITEAVDAVLALISGDDPVDPVEAKARELFDEAGRGNSKIEFDEIRPDHRGEYRRIAAYVLGQDEAS